MSKVVYRQPDMAATYRTRRPLDRQALGAVAGALQEEEWQTVEYHEPARPASREADVLVPLLQAIVTGILGGLIALMLALAGVVARGWPWWAVPVCSGCASVMVATVQWVRLLKETRALLVKRERWERPQGLGERGQGRGEKVPAETLRVEVKDETDGGVRWTIDELPISREQLTVLARRVDIGLGKWSRRSLAEIRGVGEERARTVLAELERYGYLHYPNGRNHSGGAVPTAKGAALFRGLLSD